jgi:hypothetical protein
MSIAREYGQDPRAVAAWEPEWLAAASTVMAAESGAESEKRLRDERRARARRAGGR